MSLSAEVEEFLSLRNLAALPQSEAEAITRRITLPLSLDLMSSYEQGAPTLDIDDWNRNSGLALRAAHECLASGTYYLFMSASPRSFLISIEKEALLALIFEKNFYFSFAVFSASLADYLFEDHSGFMVAGGVFAPLIEAARREA